MKLDKGKNKKSFPFKEKEKVYLLIGY